MGKRLIIKGADFSENGIKGVQLKNSIKTTQDDQFVHILDKIGTFNPAVNSVEVEYTAHNNSRGYVFIAQSPSRIFTGSNEMQLYYGNNAAAQNAVSIVIDERASVVLTPTKGYINGEEFEYTQEVVSKATTEFRVWGGSSNDAGNISIHRLAVKDAEDNYLVNLLPAIDDEDVACLYDTVSEEFVYAEDGELLAE